MDLKHQEFLSQVTIKTQRFFSYSALTFPPQSCSWAGWVGGRGSRWGRGGRGIRPGPPSRTGSQGSPSGKPLVLRFPQDFPLKRSEKCQYLKPILHTTWLNNHALTLKINTPKHYFGEKSSFLHTKNLLWFKENLSQGENLYGWGTITYKTTISKPHV